ncbi:MAG: hypothetical protein R2822_09265 [Spirosomataceae bacterium]
MSVNDDAVALKGGKGPWAEHVPNNGANFNMASSGIGIWILSFSAHA